MDKTLPLIYKTLNFYSFSQFYSGPAWKKLLFARRILLFTLSGLFNISLIWCICDKNTNFSDRIFLLALLFGVLSSDWQYWVVWNHSSNFIELFNWIKERHKTNKEGVFEKMSRDGYARLADFLWKYIRFEIKYNFTLL